MFEIRQSIKPEFQEMYRGGNIKPTELLPFLHTQGQLPFNLAWFTKNYTLASYYGPVRNYVLTLYKVKEVSPTRWLDFDKTMLHINPQPVIDLKAQGYDAVRCQFTSGMDAVLLLGANSANCKTVERLPYQGKTQPTKLKKRPEIDPDEYDDIMSWAYGDHPPNQDEGEVKFRWKI